MRTTHRIAALLGGAALASAAHAVPVTSVGTGNVLVTVDSATPGTVLRSTAISGLGAGQSLIGIDARPATGGRALYGLSNTGQLYAINVITGTASAVGAPIALIAQQGGVRTDIDFNPTVDRIRVVNATGLNIRVNPNDGSVTAYDGTLNRPVAGKTGADYFGVAGAAYTNNVAGATTTTLYDINETNGHVSIQNPPNTGSITELGLLGVTSTAPVGFDISGTTGQALATITNAAGRTSLYSIDLQSGVATLIGTFGTSGQFNGLAFTPASFASTAGSANQVAVAGAIDNFTGNPTSSLIGLFNSLDGLGSAAARNAAFTQLGPNQYSILPEIALQSNEFVDGTLRRYLRDARAGGTGSTDTAMADGSDRKTGGFLIGSGRTGKFKARGDRAQVDYGSTGFIAGADIRLGEKTLLGVTGGYDRADYRLNQISPNSRSRNGFVGGYGTVGLGAFYVDFDGTYGTATYDMQRRVAFGTINDLNLARTTSRYYTGTATAGFSLDMQGVETELFGGARYAHVNVRAFGETGGVSALNVSAQRLESLQSIAGVRLGLDYLVGGAHVRPSIRAEYRHEFKNDDPRLLTASFGGGNGIGGTTINYVTTPLGKDYGVVGGGITISGNSPIAVVLDYTGQFYGGYEIHAAQVGVRLSM